MANVKFTAKEKAFIDSVHKMHGAVGGLAAKINVDLVRSFKEADKANREFGRGITRTGNELKDFGTNWTTSVSVPLLGFGGVAMKVFGDLEAVGKGLEIVEGSSAAAGASLERIKAIAKLPGLGMQEAAQGYTNMRALGFAANFAEKALKAVGNATALGGKGKFEFNNIITQLNQMASKPSLMMEDLKPILNSAPVIAMKIKEIYGSINAEDINKQLTGGPQEFIKTLVDELATVPTAASGAKNAIENFGDSAKVAGANIGEVINESAGLTDFINSLGDNMVSVSESFKGLNSTTKDSAVLLGGLAIAFGPVSYGIGIVGAAIPGLVTGLSAVRLATGGIITVLAGAAYVYMEHEQRLRDIKKATESVEEVNARISVQYYNEIKNVQDLVEVLRNEKSSKDQVKKAKEDLIKLDPAFKSALIGEKTNFGLLNDQISKYIGNLTAAAKVKVFQSKIDANVAMEQKILEDPSSNLSVLEMIQNGITAKWGKSRDEIVNQTATKNAQTIIKLRDANAKFEKEVLDIMKGGFKPEENNIAKENSSSSKLPGGTVKELEAALKKELEQKVNAVEKHKALLAYRLRRQESEKVGGGDFVSKMESKDRSKEIQEVEEIFSTMMGFNYNFEADGNSNLQKRLDKLVGDNIKIIQTASDKKAQAMMLIKAQNAEALNANIMSSLVNFGEAALSGGGFGNAFVGLFTQMGDALIQFGKNALIAEKAIQFVKASFGSGPGGALAAIGAGLAIKVVGQQMKAPKLAKGGMATGPMTAIIGDNASGKEAVVPFERMGEFLKMAGYGGNNGVEIVTEQRVRAKNIVLIQKRLERSVR
jgi:tape measure domain-containing protein